MERVQSNVWSVIEKRSDIFAPTLSWDNSFSFWCTIFSPIMCVLMGIILYRHTKWIYDKKSCSGDKKDRIWMKKLVESSGFFMCGTVIVIELIYVIASMLTYIREIGNDYFNVEYGVYVELGPAAENYQLLVRLRALELGMTMYAFFLFVMSLVAKESLIDNFMSIFFW